MSQKKCVPVFVLVFAVVLMTIIFMFVKISTDHERESFERNVVSGMIEAHKMMWAIHGYDNFPTDSYVFKIGKNDFRTTFTRNRLMNGVSKNYLSSCNDGIYVWYGLNPGTFRNDSPHEFSGCVDIYHISARMTEDFRGSLIWNCRWKIDINQENPVDFLRMELNLSDLFIKIIEKMANNRKMNVLHYLNWTYYGG